MKGLPDEDAARASFSSSSGDPVYDNADKDGEPDEVEDEGEGGVVPAGGVAMFALSADVLSRGDIIEATNE